MGDFLSVIVMFTVLIWGWRKLAALMQARGHRWWIRHPAAFFASILGSIGAFSFCMGVGLTSGQSGIDVGSLVLAGFFLAPLVWGILLNLGSASEIKRLAARPAPTQSKLQTSQPDDLLHFVYEDARGDISVRQMTDWHFDGEYIRGFCHRAGDTRTFRFDRVVEFIAGEELLEDSVGSKIELDMEQLVNTYTSKRAASAQPEILFTGFSASVRESLEDTARDEGMKVRKTVTKNLTFLCAGPNAGPTKVAEAKSRGALVLDEDQFWTLIETGEIEEA